MQQPFLSQRSVVLAAPVQMWSALDGQADASAAGRTVEGAYCGDTRVLSQVLLDSPSHELEHVATDERGGACSRFQYVLRTPQLGVDPALVLDRFREVHGSGLRERFVLATAAPEAQHVELRLVLRPDATAMQEIKSGQGPVPVAAEVPAAGPATFSWRDERTSAVVTTDARIEPLDGALQLSWRVEVPARGSIEVAVEVALSDRGAPFVACTAAPLAPPATSGTNPALDRLLSASFADINGLRLAHPDTPGSAFLAAGAPWYFTLFGRDSLIAALNLLPHDLTVAQGTLAVLAGLQGERVDVDAAEQPGKILHEVRQQPLELALAHMGQQAHRMSLPPLYYGTIDATCLWVVLLDRAEQAGLDRAVVRELLPALDGALAWIRDWGDADGDGFLEYVDESGHGLANQGWKDSGDSVRFADGTMADGPVALCEVQGYAHAALLGGARLLEAHRPGSDEPVALRARAEVLAQRFREAFWSEDELGRYPVLALDGRKRQVDGVASNMGHLLGTGILDADEARLVVERLLHPSMDSGYGIRTLSTTNGGYWPLGYHVGSVWSHDTALVIDGMLREGFADQARRLAAGLLRAAEGFGFRLPELFSGVPADQVFPPQPYPASCRPQAWAATSSVVLARALA